MPARTSQCRNLVPTKGKWDKKNKRKRAHIELKMIREMEIITMTDTTKRIDKLTYRNQP